MTSKADLVAQAESLGLPTEGTKAQLEERIAASQRPSAHPKLVAAVRAAEAAGQRAQCRVPAGDLPPELVEALDRRVAVNLAATGGKPLQSCGGSDPDVQRLEAPYKPQAAEPDLSDEQPPSAVDLTHTEGVN